MGEILVSARPEPDHTPEGAPDTLRLILGSSSPYRRELLTRLLVPFEVDAPDVDETPEPGESPEQLVRRLSLLKAKTVAARHRHALVIGSDQVAVYDGHIVGKPYTHERAVQQLLSAAGKTVTLHTGLALINSTTGRVQCEVIPFRVVFRALTREDIERYLHKERPYHCAGSVRSEGLGIALLERFEGEDPNTLIGLPLIRLIRMLEYEGLRLF